MDVDATASKAVSVDLDSHTGAEATVDASAGVPFDGTVGVDTHSDVHIGAPEAVAKVDEPGDDGLEDLGVGPESAAIGTALGAIAVLAAWALLKYGSVLGVGAPLFSRIKGHRILDNEVRNQVHKCIVATPGVTIKRVATLLGIGWGTAVYHLRRLERQGLVVSQRNRQFRRYYKNGGGVVNDDKAAFAELQNPVTERLASEIVKQPGTGQKALCAAVGISAPLAHKHLAWLEDAELLTKQRQWRAVMYFPTNKLLGFLPPSPLTVPA